MVREPSTTTTIFTNTAKASATTSTTATATTLLTTILCKIMSVNLGNDTKASSPVRTPEETKESKYEPKQNKKIIRLLTVIAYVISVSMAAIILSLYYVFLWDPKETYSPKDIFDPQNQSSVASMPDLISTPFSSGKKERKKTPITCSFVVVEKERKKEKRTLMHRSFVVVDRD